MDLATFCDSFSTMKHPCGPFYLEITELSFILPLCGSSQPTTLHPHICACGFDKISIQLAMHCGEGSFIELEYYTAIVMWQIASLHF